MGLTSGDDDAVDYSGIQGWGKVDALARALLKTTGLSVSSSKAEHIIQLYSELDEFDKRPVEASNTTEREVCQVKVKPVWSRDSGQCKKVWLFYTHSFI